ncbi:MAG: hypothetical protein K8M05_07330 [Deltaproteobacteria bacterium]|nr:hypothetical protein [Kofleriaceae bacterium]
MLKRLALLCLPLAACVEADDDAVQLLADELPAEVRLDPGGAGSPFYGVLEYGTGWDKEWLEVCWEPNAYSDDPTFGPMMAEARAWVQQAVRQEWGRVSRIKFPEIWPSCDDPLYQPDIRIAHDDFVGWSYQGTEARDVASGPTMAINLIGPALSTCIPTGGGPGGGGYIPQCNGTILGGNPASRQNWTEALALHLFGYALGLRKEDVHPEGEPCPGVEEELDSAYGDGEALWGHDPLSVMETCRLYTLAYGTARPTLSAGDIRSANSLYPGVVRMFPLTDLGGTSWPLGPGYYTRATHPDLAGVSSLVIPPGYRVRVCTTSSCATYTSTRRALSTTYDDKLQNVSITLQGYVAEQPGFIGAAQWFYPGTYKASQGHLGTVGNNAISSAWVAPGHAITLCDGETPSPISCISAVGGTLGVPALVKLPGPLVTQTFASWNMDNVASYVKVSPRVVTYASADFVGTSYSLAEGVYTVSGGSTYLGQVRALSVPAGLEASVCNKESVMTFPRPVCQTFTQSGTVNANLVGQIKRLEVRKPLENAPP